MTTPILIDGFNLTADKVVAIARDPSIKVGLAQSSRDALKQSRDYIESTWMHDDAPMMADSPICSPWRMTAPAPTRVSRPITTLPDTVAAGFIETKSWMAAS